MTRAISTTSRRELSSIPPPPPPLQGKAPKEIHAILTETLSCFLPDLAKDLSAPLYLSVARLYKISQCFNLYRIPPSRWPKKKPKHVRGFQHDCIVCTVTVVGDLGLMLSYFLDYWPGTFFQLQFRLMFLDTTCRYTKLCVAAVSYCKV